MAGSLPDIIAADLRVLFCGLNPGLDAAATGHYFVGRGNRFWRVMHLAGFTPTQIDPMHDATLLSFGFGLTAVVARPTAGADKIAKDEFLAGADVLSGKIERYAPRNVAFLGKAAFAAIAGKRAISCGRQPATMGGAAVWVLPNPSGCNRGFTLSALVAAYRLFRRALD